MKISGKETALSWAVAGSTFLSGILGGPAIAIEGNQFALIHNEQVIEAPMIPQSTPPGQRCQLEE